jgi:short-subunit dehydrogenase
MKPARKPLTAQTMVITGATSGIGLATARLAAKRGARLLLVSRNENALRSVSEELRVRGAEVDYAQADVADETQLRGAAEKAERMFGGFDTWINNAGVSVYGRIEDVPLADQRRLFDTNYWGVVHGSLIAVEFLKARATGGTIINLGSVLSDYPMPIQGPYSASKHAVKGFTNALRLELMKSAPGISVTLIKPSAIDTPYKEHARSYMDAPGTNPPPSYAAELVAEAILYAAQTPTREITVGAAGRLMAIAGQLLPVIADPLLAHLIPRFSRDKPSNHPSDSDALYKPGRDLRVHSRFPLVRRTSLYTAAQMKPQVTAAALFTAGVFAAVAMTTRSRLRLARIRAEARARALQDLEA